MGNRVEARVRRWRVRYRRALLAACSLAPLALACTPALAQGQPSPSPTPSPSPAPGTVPVPGDGLQGDIVVIGNRAIIASLQDVPVERTYDEDDVASYDVSTVGELLDEIRSESGDGDVSILVNGRPVADPANISDLPVEAISRIEALPRGAAQRVGGAVGQRAYNVVLKRQVRSATFTGSEQLATEGGWNSSRGEALFTYIQGQDRINLTVRGSDSGNLFESERPFTPYAERAPYSPIGNIVPLTGSEVDPALSALAGGLVTVVALPAGNSSPTLAQLVAGANQTNPSNVSLYRTLRGASQPLDVALAGNKTLTPWLSASFNGRLNWTRSESFSGLPAARFQILPSNAFTPFTTPVYIAVNDPSRPLRNLSRANSQSASATLDAQFAGWRESLTARWDQRERTYRSAFTGALPGTSGTVDALTNPFAGTLAALIPVDFRLSRSKTTVSRLEVDIDGPLFDLPAGPARAHVDGDLEWDVLHATDVAGERSFRRHEYGIKAALMLALTSRERFLPLLGDSEVALELGRSSLGSAGHLDHNSIAFNWQPADWLRFVANTQRDDKAIAPELLAAPAVVTPNVPYFDPLTGETVDVTQIYGGAGNVKSEEWRSRALSWTVTPLAKYRLRLTADYQFTDIRHQIGSLPPPSSAIVAAFPDRFQRDASGTLILVDSRSVNFARQRSGQLRFGAGFTVPLTKPVMIPADREAGIRAHRVPPLNLQLDGSYTVLLSNRLLIREGLPEIDLLKGGAIGVAGGQQRHAWDLNLALTKEGTGVRVSARNRGERYLVTGSMAAPDLLTFHPITTVDAKAFAALDKVFPKSTLLKNTRLTLGVDNLLGDRQRVRDRSGAVPQAYQPVRLDPVGRTVMLEIRKAF